MAATLAYFYATHFSMLAIAAILVSLYPGVTVLLARTLLHERFTPAQRAGLGLAGAGLRVPAGRMGPAGARRARARRGSDPCRAAMRPGSHGM
jgi:EamA-like transporter family